MASPYAHRHFDPDRPLYLRRPFFEARRLNVGDEFLWRRADGMTLRLVQILWDQGVLSHEPLGDVPPAVAEPEPIHVESEPAPYRPKRKS